MNVTPEEGAEGLKGMALRPFVLGLGDFVLLNASFWAVNAWKGEGWALSGRNRNLLLAFWGLWLLVSLVIRKFRLKPAMGYWRGVWGIVRSGLYLAYCMALMVVLLGEYKLSRGQVFGTCLMLAGLEWGAFTLLYAVVLQGSGVGGWRLEVGGQRAEGRGRRLKGMSAVLWLADAGLVGIAFFVVNYLKRGSFDLPPDYQQLLLLIYGVWFICSAVTGKFLRKVYANFYHLLWPWLKSGALMFLTLGLIVFLLGFVAYSRTQVFGSVLVLMFFECILCALYFGRKEGKKGGKDIESPEDRQKVLRQDKLPVDLDLETIRARLLEPVREGLRDSVFKDNPPLFDFLDRHLDLSGIVRAEMVLRNSPELLSPLDRLENRATRLSINLHKANDIRWLNRYLLEVHNQLVSGGYAVAMAHTIKTHWEWMFGKYPRTLAYILYSVNFALHRVMPKLPWVRQVYFSVTKGKNRALSRAELLGRLCFCGFDIVAEQEINKRLYVLAQKRLTPSTNDHPSYGPFVELPRMGANGEVLSIYKFRTMHPYSEFLQDYVYSRQGLQKGGKLEDDFRVTGWGKVMRRLWLDELPMLYNWVRGDLKLFGVRPLSAHYFDLYPKDLQELRMKVKPGLVPPFYADMPETFEEICESEKRYIDAYLERPLRTQVGYFWRAFVNIVFKGARSK